MSDPLARLQAALSHHYRVERELGAGGMATVYLAHDLKHDRDVAIKVLHPDLGAALGGERFLSEIRTTARLQHPHILPLLDSGDADDGLLYYVMPLVTGETLRTRLTRERQLPIPEAVRLAREVASALDYAHRQGVIHRDIKPENVLLHDGSALVADFGIALAVQQAGGQRMTQTGLSLGTPQYMSPEQAMGERTIDARSDVYALGAVTYEMLSGDAPFSGNSAQAIVAKVLNERPTALHTLRDTVPPHVEQAVLTALAKLPADRFESAKAFADALGSAGPHSGVVTPGMRGRPSSNRWKWAALACAVAAVTTAGVAATIVRRARSAPRDVGLPPDAPIRMEDAYRNFAAAHDGSFIVYEARVGASSQLWYRSLVGPEVRALAGTEGAYGTPRISPDDRRVAFVAASELRIASLAGGPITTIARATDPEGGGWLDSGVLFFSDEDGRKVRWVDPETGPARSVAVTYCLLVQPMAGDAVLCDGGAEKYASVRRLADPERVRLVRRTRAKDTAGPPLLLGSDFRIVDGRYLVYIAADGTIMATRFESVDSLTVGRSVALVPTTRRSAYSGAGHYDVTRSGALVYAPGINAEVGRLVRRAPNGPAVPLPIEPAAYLRFAPSPDGKRLAAVVTDIQQEELRVYDLATGAHETIDRALYIGGAVWSPDSRDLVYKRIDFDAPDRETLYRRRLDSSEPSRPLLATGMANGIQPSSYLANDFLIAGTRRPGGMAIVIDATKTPLGVDSLPVPAFFVSVSPDRRSIAYQNQGATGGFVQPFPALDRRYQLDATAQEPLWRSATELLYFTKVEGKSAPSQAFYRVTIDPATSAPVGKPELLFSDPRFSDTAGWSHALMPNGDLVYLQTPSDNLGYYVRVIPDWVAAMKRAVDAANR